MFSVLFLSNHSNVVKLHQRINMRAILKSLMFDLRTWLGAYPRLFFPLYGLKPKNKALFIAENTGLVVVAYPRTANTFFVVALRRIQREPIEIAHHLHVPALAIEGVKRQLPTVVLVRKPDEAITSLVIREPHLSLNQAIKAYLKFHEPLLPLKSHIQVLDFKNVINDFPSCVDQVNQRFGMSLDNYSASDPLNKEAIFKEIEDINKSFNKEQLVETMVSRPSAERKKIQEEQRMTLINDPKYKAKLARCFECYRALTSL